MSSVSQLSGGIDDISVDYKFVQNGIYLAKTHKIRRSDSQNLQFVHGPVPQKITEPRESHEMR